MSPLPGVIVTTSPTLSPRSATLDKSAETMKRSRTRLCLLVVALWCLGHTPLHSATNFVVNGDFSQDVSGWQHWLGQDIVSTTGTWPLSSDYHAGKVLLLRRERLEQCIQIREDENLEEPRNPLPRAEDLLRPWRMSVSHAGSIITYWPFTPRTTPETPSSSLEMNVIFHQEGDCSGNWAWPDNNIYPVRPLSPPNLAYWPDWFRSGRQFEIPPHAKALAVSILNSGYDDSVAVVDNVVVAPGDLLYYKAYGDSYSAGTGVGFYDAHPRWAPPSPPIRPSADGSDILERERCHRSSGAYSRQLAEELRFATGGRLEVAMRHLACHGAETPHLDGRQGSEPSQLGSPTNGPTYTSDGALQLITLTIGGNDLGFAEMVESCVLNPCSGPLPESGETVYETFRRRIWADVRPKVVDTYQRIRNRYTNATIAALGYPRLFGSAGVFCPRSSGIIPSEAALLDDLADELDFALSTAAAEVGIHYVSVIGAFQNHGICSSTAGIIGLTARFSPYARFFIDVSESYHPNGWGHELYARELSLELGIVQSGETIDLPPNPEPQTGQSCPGDFSPTPGDQCVPEFWNYSPKPELLCEANTSCDRDFVLAGETIRLDNGVLHPALGAQYGGETVIELVTSEERVELARYGVTDPFAGYQRVVDLDLPPFSESEPYGLITVSFRPAGWWREDNPEVPEVVGGATRVVVIGTTDAGDTDGDSVPDYRDDCRDEPNWDQADADGDRIGDVCDPIDGPALFFDDFEEGDLSRW